jgi:hypothetical protein
MPPILCAVADALTIDLGLERSQQRMFARPQPEVHVLAVEPAKQQDLRDNVDANAVLP